MWQAGVNSMQRLVGCVNNIILHPNNCRVSLKGLKHPPQCRKQVGMAEEFLSGN